MGRDFAVFRTLGLHHPIRTEQHDSRWLNGKKVNLCAETQAAIYDAELLRSGCEGSLLSAVRLGSEWLAGFGC